MSVSVKQCASRSTPSQKSGKKVMPTKAARECDGNRKSNSASNITTFQLIPMNNTNYTANTMVAHQLQPKTQTHQNHYYAQLPTNYNPMASHPYPSTTAYNSDYTHQHPPAHYNPSPYYNPDPSVGSTYYTPTPHYNPATTYHPHPTPNYYTPSTNYETNFNHSPHSAKYTPNSTHYNPSTATITPQNMSPTVIPLPARSIPSFPSTVVPIPNLAAPTNALMEITPPMLTSNPIPLQNKQRLVNSYEIPIPRTKTIPGLSTLCDAIAISSPFSNSSSPSSSTPPLSNEELWSDQTADLDLEGPVLDMSGLESQYSLNNSSTNHINNMLYKSIDIAIDDPILEMNFATTSSVSSTCSSHTSTPSTSSSVPSNSLPDSLPLPRTVEEEPHEEDDDEVLVTTVRTPSPLLQLDVQGKPAQQTRERRIPTSIETTKDLYTFVDSMFYPANKSDLQHLESLFAKPISPLDLQSMLATQIDYDSTFNSEVTLSSASSWSEQEAPKHSMLPNGRDDDVDEIIYTPCHNCSSDDSSHIDFEDELELTRLLWMQQHVNRRLLERLQTTVQAQLPKINIEAKKYARAISNSRLTVPFRHRALHTDVFVELRNLLPEEQISIKEYLKYQAKAGPPLFLASSRERPHARGKGKNKTSSVSHGANPSEVEVSTILEASDQGEAEVACAVCLSGEVEFGDEILFCDECSVAVHQKCYGVVNVPTGDWYCKPCEFIHQQGRSVVRQTGPRCTICWQHGGAMKPIKRPPTQVVNFKAKECPNIRSFITALKSDSGSHSSSRLFYGENHFILWAHLTCAQWVPELHIGNPELMEPVCGIEKLNKDRYKLKCIICKQVGGACIQCIEGKCTTAFHVHCAMKANYELISVNDHLAINGPRFISYCNRHRNSQKHNVTYYCTTSKSDLKATRASLPGIQTTNDKSLISTDGLLPVSRRISTAVCQVCDFGCIPPSDSTMLVCAKCKVHVHKDCFAKKVIFDDKDNRQENWLCDVCDHKRRNLIPAANDVVIVDSPDYQCVVCTRRGGILKPTICNRWCHLVCAYWIEQLFIECDRIANVDHVLKERRYLLCELCSTRKGACVKCSYPNCRSAFHLSCARDHRLYTAELEDSEDADIREPYLAYCRLHTNMIPLVDANPPSDLISGAKVAQATTIGSYFQRSVPLRLLPSPPPCTALNEKQVDNSGCCICAYGLRSTASSDCSNLVECSVCHIRLHPNCYGLADDEIHNGQFLCRVCKGNPSQRPALVQIDAPEVEPVTSNSIISCAICLHSGGALKPTTCLKWVHISCAYYVPELYFIDSDTHQPIEGCDTALKARRLLKCIFCKRDGGASVQCSHNNCYKAMHVSCAKQHDVVMGLMPDSKGDVNYSIFCPTHSQKRKQAAVTDQSEHDCSICNFGVCVSTDRTSEVYQCGKCALQVHPLCYGIPSPTPNTDWRCLVCSFRDYGCQTEEYFKSLGIVPPAKAKKKEPTKKKNESTKISQCCICLHKDNRALKPTNCGSWCHVTCALFVPQLFFVNSEALEPIDGVKKALQIRKSLSCSLCENRGGACIQCAHLGCSKSFHVTCAFYHGFLLKELDEANEVNGGFAAYCGKHSGQRRNLEVVSETVPGKNQKKSRNLSSTEIPIQIPIAIPDNCQIEAEQSIELKNNGNVLQNPSFADIPVAAPSTANVTEAIQRSVSVLSVDGDVAETTTKPKYKKPRNEPRKKSKHILASKSYKNNDNDVIKILDSENVSNSRKRKCIEKPSELDRLCRMEVPDKETSNNAILVDEDVAQSASASEPAVAATQLSNHEAQQLKPAKKMKKSSKSLGSREQTQMLINNFITPSASKPESDACSSTSRTASEACSLAKTASIATPETSSSATSSGRKRQKHQEVKPGTKALEKKKTNKRRSTSDDSRSTIEDETDTENEMEWDTKPNAKRTKSNSQKEIYCVCRQPAGDDRMMIACDYCGDWFHYDCVKLTPAIVARIDVYACDECATAGKKLKKKRGRVSLLANCEEIVE